MTELSEGLKRTLRAVPDAWSKQTFTGGDFALRQLIEAGLVESGVGADAMLYRRTNAGRRALGMRP